MKPIIYCAIIGLMALMACEPTKPIEKAAAKVDTVNGLYVYIKSQPMKTYKIYDQPINREAAEEILNASKKKGFWNALGGLTQGVAKNISFQEQINAMTILTKEIYPQADGVIFSKSLNQCVAFQFQE